MSSEAYSKSKCNNVSDSDKCNSADCCCSNSPVNPSVVQNLNELEFERGIWQAALDGDCEKIENLVNRQKIHPDSKDSYGYTALHYAARKGNLGAAELLIKLGADVNSQTKNNKSTPLHRAVLAKNAKMIELLLKNGADSKITDADGLSPIERCQKEFGNSGFEEGLRLLEKKIIDSHLKNV